MYYSTRAIKKSTRWDALGLTLPTFQIALTPHLHEHRRAARSRRLTDSLFKRNIFSRNCVDERNRRKKQSIIDKAVQNLQFEDETIAHIGKVTDVASEMRLYILDDGSGKT